MKKEKRIFALGFFDGVHLGHQALIAEACRLADETEAWPAAITFDRHPLTLFAAETPPLINTVRDRRDLLTDYGIKDIYVLPTTKEVMSTPWQDFLENLLDDGAVGFVCGEDFHFGHKGEGDAEKLRQFCSENAFPCVIVPEQTAEGQRISSTRIRILLEAGHVEEANRLLGHPHILSGTVVPGRQLGRTIGIPTANLELSEGILIPRFGVYACRVYVGYDAYMAVANVGTRPTVSGHHVTVEPWILDFDGDLYGKTITLEFHSFLRPERKFDSLEALQGEIQKNAAQTRNFFEKM